MIRGYKDISLIDYPGLLAPVVFLGGCNFQCPFCHNRDLVLKPQNKTPFTEEDILTRIEDARVLADGVVITGGEPTLWSGLEDFIIRLKAMGLKVKLDTNGSLPAILEDLTHKNLLDYIAMDIKSPLEDYNRAAGVCVNAGSIVKSIDLIQSSGLNHEFRTTCVPGFIDEQAIQSICSLLAEGERYTLQNFKPVNTIDPRCMEIRPFSSEEMEGFRIKCCAAGLNAKVI
ncbi:MAG: anaerobic ribonucleoside-triphosphate reductase activating protein [Dehalococcoidaceae bacterium]|nr:anaerobic ribonucleoside-triphosphate reductase activating protein [Dehalococcoidaceae bacterium]